MLIWIVTWRGTPFYFGSRDLAEAFYDRKVEEGVRYGLIGPYSDMVVMPAP